MTRDVSPRLPGTPLAGDGDAHGHWRNPGVTVRSGPHREGNGNRRGRHRVRGLTLILAAAGVAVLGATGAAGAGKPLTPQEQRAATCAKQAEALEAGRRKAFMDACLAGSPSARPAPAPDGRERAAACAAQAKGEGLSGTAYHDFVESCAKG